MHDMFDRDTDRRCFVSTSQAQKSDEVGFSNANSITV